MTDSSTSNSNLGQDRQSFMKAIHDALGRQTSRPPAESPPAVDESIVRLGRKDDDLAGLFTYGAESVGMIVRRVQAPELT